MLGIWMMVQTMMNGGAFRLRLRTQMTEILMLVPPNEQRTDAGPGRDPSAVISYLKKISLEIYRHSNILFLIFLFSSCYITLCFILIYSNVNLLMHRTFMWLIERWKLSIASNSTVRSHPKQAKIDGCWQCVHHVPEKASKYAPKSWHVFTVCDVGYRYLAQVWGWHCRLKGIHEKTYAKLGYYLHQENGIGGSGCSCSGRSGSGLLPLRGASLWLLQLGEELL